MTKSSTCSVCGELLEGDLAVLSHEILGRCRGKKMTKVLIVDQFFGPSPYEVQRRGLLFEEFSSDCLRAAQSHLCKAELREVADTAKLERRDLPRSSTAYIASPDGTAEMLMGNWGGTE